MSCLDRRPWTEDEDVAIRNLVSVYGTKKWSMISDKLETDYSVKGRTGKQCRERWHNHLDPSVNKDPWLSDEEQVLFDSYEKFGNHWAEIARMLPGRTDNAIKNHFYSAVRRNLRKLKKTRPRLTGSLSNLLRNKQVADELTRRPEKLTHDRPKPIIPEIKVETEACDHEASSLLYHLYTSSRNGTPKANPAQIVCPSPSRYSFDPFSPNAGIYAMTPSAMIGTPMFHTSKFSFPEEVSSKFTWEAYDLPVFSEEPTPREGIRLSMQMQSPSNFLAPFSPLHCIPRNS